VKRTQAALFALIPAFALGYAACVGGPATEGEETTAEDEAAMIAPDPALYGTYRNENDDRIGSLSVLVLMLDGTYHRGMTAECTRGPCQIEDDGLFRLRVRGDDTYISLYPDRAIRAVADYHYVLAGETMRLWSLGDGIWMSLQKTEAGAWCSEPVDCNLQNLPVGPCASHWQCVSTYCRYECGPTYPEE
jgi:hypothetical protein